MGCGTSSFLMYNKITSDYIRVVHFDGRIEDYDMPIKVSQVIKNPERDVLCTKSQLLSPTSFKFLKPDSELQLGILYFLIPVSTFTSEVSVLDMANMVNKLTNISKSTARMKESLRPVEAADGHIGTEHGSPRSGHDESGNGNLERCVWKPVLETIGERTFNGRSESDVIRTTTFIVFES